ncbi:MAG: acetate--CoA ligase [Flavobacteriales bacterium]|jgi:acetyl-CoA synthetase|nr:acetate--CoA ligase [Flavobacteriales bacterium]MBK6882728.1 acetate--CoA ligase [Flavobacteriales bacterium]MBK7103463.1 acetate--CoA ligase [Flavobacteriales bacterium]MBK7114061.1 acetate--CoA ligase [Flavobacteriales bacterium]MBK7619976.1 acetate--CoA ligase [Flavobacteriales bacterium]
MSFNRIRTQQEYTDAYALSIRDPEGFWAAQAEPFTWRKTWDKTLVWDFEKPDVQWFVGGKLNITENCLDRHLAERANKLAIIWEPNDPKERPIRLTYRELHERVCSYANVLKRNGIKKGDRVAVYMPMIPELMIAVLACARIGAIHSVVFCGFSAQSLSDRINDAGAVAVLCSDGMFRGAKEMPVKTVVDEALEQCTTVKTVIVTERVKWAVKMVDGRDVWLHEELVHVDADCPAEEMDAEDPLFILYTSGSTGKPKGVVHTCGGFMVYVDYSFRNVFQVEESDVFFCTADVGWITGHSYMAYGPTLAGATQVMFEGVPTFPDAGRFWQVVDKHAITIFYTAPTAIRSLMAHGIDHVLPYSLHSLRVLGSVGEPINEEAWHWYKTHIGKGRCPVVDTWWQTETGGIMISSIAGVTDEKPSHAAYPLPGIQPVLLTAEGKEITENEVEGLLCMKFPWPGILRTTWGDHERCRQTYFSSYKGMYFTGDGAKRDADGRYRIIGRVDDVINVSGHRFGTAEIESAINTAKGVVESAVVGYPHDIKGQGIYAYVVTEKPVEDVDDMRGSIIEAVVASIGRIAKPDKIQFVTGLPKTRSGKIMRRILRKVAENELNALGDTSTLLDPAVVEEIKEGRV